MKNRPPVSYLDPPVYYESANLDTPLFIWGPPVYSAGESMIMSQINNKARFDTIMALLWRFELSECNDEDNRWSRTDDGVGER